MSHPYAKASGDKPRVVAYGGAERRAAHGDLESPEPGLIHPRREAVGVWAAPASARPATMGRKRRRAAALQIEQPGYNILTSES